MARTVPRPPAASTLHLDEPRAIGVERAPVGHANKVEHDWRQRYHNTTKSGTAISSATQSANPSAIASHGTANRHPSRIAPPQRFPVLGGFKRAQHVVAGDFPFVIVERRDKLALNVLVP